MCEVIRSQEEPSLSLSLSLPGPRQSHRPLPPSLCSPQQSIMGFLGPAAEDQLLLPVHELLREAVATALEFLGDVRTL